jgi:hypothetical protein
MRLIGVNYETHYPGNDPYRAMRDMSVSAWMVFINIEGILGLQLPQLSSLLFGLLELPKGQNRKLLRN